MKKVEQETKRCTKCGDEKLLKEFHKDKHTKDGFKFECKHCRSKYRKGLKGKEADRRYRRTGKKRIADKRYYSRHPEKMHARGAATYAVERGDLERPWFCFVNDSQCEGPIQKHHEDYSNPFGVLWLCRYHHQQLHTSGAEGQLIRRIINNSLWPSLLSVGERKATKKA